MMNSAQFSRPLSIKSIKVTDPFWKNYMELVRTEVIPYQWEALNDRIEGAEPSYCIQNFKIAAGLMEGKFQGMVFQDSDVYKWLEAVAFSLVWHPDEQLEKTADEVIDLISLAQQPDGYLNTYYIINGLDKRFTNLRDNHELYCLGHMLEAAIAYYEATGKDKFLNTAIKYVDCVDSLFGAEEAKINGYPGHEVIEMALMRLYEIRKEEKYLKLAKYFIDERGQSPLYFEIEGENQDKAFWWKDSHFKYQYYQAGKPVREQDKAEGHAVRAVYLYAGMADVAKVSGDESLFEACSRLWDNVTKRQMYITGAIGSSEYGEAFTYDYDLPNDTVYAETCASIGLVFFARRMLEIGAKGEYADVMERALYNGIISGISLDGKKFFYVNPLEVVPEASQKDYLRKHVKVERQKWFGCACCPPNVARLLASIGNYAYSQTNDTFYMHLFLGGAIDTEICGIKLGLDVATSYPWNEEVKVKVSLEKAVNFKMAVRVPSWCSSYSFKINGEEADYAAKDGYIYIEREWQNGDEISYSLGMSVNVIKSNPRVRENIGKVAITRGPLVYCLEEEDNGADLHRVYLSEAPRFNERYEEDLLNGIVTITSQGKVLSEEEWEERTLYKADTENVFYDKELKWIPYYTWANRKPGEMMVWVRKQ